MPTLVSASDYTVQLFSPLLSIIPYPRGPSSFSLVESAVLCVRNSKTVQSTSLQDK